MAFFLAATGSAVGLGNIWGFPTNAASNGGAAFLFTYLILVFALAYPALRAALANHSAYSGPRWLGFLPNQLSIFIPENRPGLNQSLGG